MPAWRLSSVRSFRRRFDHFAAVNLTTIIKLPLIFRRVVEEAASGLRALLLKISPFESIKAEVQIPWHDNVATCATLLIQQLLLNASVFVFRCHFISFCIAPLLIWSADATHVQDCAASIAARARGRTVRQRPSQRLQAQICSAAPPGLGGSCWRNDLCLLRKQT